MENYKYQIVEFKPRDSKIHYWAIKKVNYDDLGNPVSIEEPKLSHSEIHAIAVSNPRISADQHNWMDTP